MMFYLKVLFSMDVNWQLNERLKERLKALEMDFGDQLEYQGCKE